MNLAILIASVCSLIGPNTSAKNPVPLAGDYVEARTASVFRRPVPLQRRTRHHRMRCGDGLAIQFRFLEPCRSIRRAA